MKRLSLAFGVLASLSLCVCHGVAINGAEAMRAAGNWLASEATLAEGLSTEPESVQTEDDGAGVSYHVVSLSGGGFVVLSADDGIEPVIAFSSTESFPDGKADSPVRSILARDLGKRRESLDAGGGAFKRLVFASGSNAATSPEAKWARLLAAPASNVKGVLYSSGLAKVSDVRVAPLVKSHWGQANETGYSNYGYPCYNFYTPNNSPCGCVATAMAQIMRFWTYPECVKDFSGNCMVNGSSTVLSAMAGAYEWGKMPLDPSKGTSMASRQAIGRLTYDCGVSVCMRYTASESGAIGSFAFKPLVEQFGYGNAISYCPAKISQDEIEQSVYPSLDAGCPVMMGLRGDQDLGHEVVVDGYGFVSGTPYVHINAGWTSTSGCDLWYNLPKVDFPTGGQEGSSYSTVEHFIYNILPTESGDVLSGRVTNKAGAPASGVAVRVYESGSSNVLARAKTSKYGVYAFVIPGNAMYDVKVGDTVLSGIFLKKSVSPEYVDLETGRYLSESMSAGNSWGNDFALDVVPEPELPEGVSVEVSCDIGGAELTVGQAVTFPVEIACTGCKVSSVKASGLPSGLKLVSGAKAAPYDYAIAGVPKKASDKPYSVKLTVTVKALETKESIPKTVAEYAVAVLPLADWAVGTFSGMAEFNGAAAALTMTVKNTGGISGKVTVGKKGYTFKADGFAAVTDAGYRVEAETKAGGLAFDLASQSFGGTPFGAVTNGGVRAAQEIWKLKAFKKFLTAYTSPDKTLSWTAAGKVTWRTTAGGKNAKLTATLLPVSYENGTVSLCAYFVADGTATRLDVRYDDLAQQSPECVFTPVN